MPGEGLSACRIPRMAALEYYTSCLCVAWRCCARHEANAGFKLFILAWIDEDAFWLSGQTPHLEFTF
jgi:hypothetical protein